jgi:hypothetical protein
MSPPRFAYALIHQLVASSWSRARRSTALAQPILPQQKAPLIRRGFRVPALPVA